MSREALHRPFAAPKVYDKPSALPKGLLESCRPMPLPSTLLMCPPEYFQVVDVKNPHMEGNVGKTDHGLARKQWDAVRAAFEQAGAKVDLIPPTPDCEDMVFCANQTLVGLDADGHKVCMLSRMKHASRQREVQAFGVWFHGAGYRIEMLPEDVGFEGSGDALWHPGRGLIWGGYG
jgi:N-dimethylarginine dimethylaminohydrolase